METVGEQGRRGELEFMIKTWHKFKFGSLQEAVSRGGKSSDHESTEGKGTVTEKVCLVPGWWLETSSQNGKEGPRDDLFAVMKQRWPHRRHSPRSWRERARSGESEDLRR